MNLDTACIISPATKTAAGYAMVRKAGKPVYVHRLVLAAKLGVSLDTIKGLDCRHKCDNPSCVNPDHLELGTRLDNVLDMVRRNRTNWATGEQASKAKLTESQVHSIRARTAESCTDLAAEFKVTHTTILKIWRRETWTHI